MAAMMETCNATIHRAAASKLIVSKRPEHEFDAVGDYPPARVCLEELKAIRTQIDYGVMYSFFDRDATNAVTAIPNSDESSPAL